MNITPDNIVDRIEFELDTNIDDYERGLIKEGIEKGLIWAKLRRFEEMLERNTDLTEAQREQIKRTIPLCEFNLVCPSE